MTYVIIAVLLILSELLYFRIARKFDIIDKPTARSSHHRDVLSGGGIIFLLAAWLYAAFFGLTHPWLMAGLTIVGTVSFADDVRPLPVAARLFAQFVGIGLMFCQFGIAAWPGWPAAVVALIVCVGILNAFNFMDGINGITCGYSLAVLLPLIYLNSRTEFIASPLLYTMGLSLAVFSFFNFRRKAKCFVGDVGAVTMAFILLYALGCLIIRTGDFSYLLLLAVYGIDTILTICHRIVLRENLGKAHRKHAYQLLANELGLSHVSVSLIYVTLQLLISAGLILLPVNHYIYVGITIIILTAVYIWLMKKYYHLHQSYIDSCRAGHRQS